ncbi:TRAP transporter small permease [Bacillus sp. FJAT-45350]|uniref:TRAP transporter small permease n=1 Tax=Bacillus sp. FJAT-45350 TaxID=2011014 RepID=UPI000BB92DBD|nr:TRAP transporter small permease subunit [Bacillus sp. FJAT-45350]
MSRVMKRIDQLSLVIGSIGLAGLMILITAGVFTRYVLNFSIPTAYEIVENYLMPITVFATLGYSYKSGILPRVDAFVEKIKSLKIKRFINSSIIMVELITFLFISYYMYQFTIYSFDNGMGFRTNGINFPLYHINFLIFISFAYMSLLILLKFIKSVKNKDDNPIQNKEVD